MTEIDPLEVEGRAGPLVDPEDAAPPLSDEEYQAMQELLDPPEIVKGAVAIADLPAGTDLVLLRPDEVPVVGTHYVMFSKQPMPVLVSSYPVSEDDHVASQGIKRLPGRLKDLDGGRADRAEEYARWRYRGFLCGEVSGL